MDTYGEEQPWPTWAELTDLLVSTRRLESLLSHKGLPPSLTEEVRTLISASYHLMDQCEQPWPRAGTRAHQAMTRAMRDATWYNTTCCTSVSHELAARGIVTEI
jgi:hypothetical protein